MFALKHVQNLASKVFPLPLIKNGITVGDIERLGNCPHFLLGI